MLAGHGVRGGPDAEVAVMGRRERLAEVRAEQAAEVAVPAELRGVVVVERPRRETFHDRRAMIRDKAKTTQSSRMKTTDEGLVAAAMVMDRSTLGHNLRPLQRDQLVVMRPDRDDRRGDRHVPRVDRRQVDR